ncbi:MAG: hypothetical protein ACLQLG_18560 [Thermoguttaceae bacterium]
MAKPELEKVAQKKGRARNPRAGILDAAKRKIILGVLAKGSTRRVAAGCVGCSPTTIYRTALRDEQFALELGRAENAAKLNFANRINAAAAEPRFWRAAAWWLERRSADDFALLSPKTVTFEQAGKMFVYLMEYIGLDMADDKIDMALERMDELIDELQEDANALAAPAPTPQAPPDETRWIDGPPLSSGEQDLSAIDPSDDV